MFLSYSSHVLNLNLFFYVTKKKSSVWYSIVYGLLSKLLQFCIHYRFNQQDKTVIGQKPSKHKRPTPNLLRITAA